MDLSVIVAATEYSLDDGTYCQHLGHVGVGMMPTHRLRQRGPMQHGETDLGFRGDPRTVQLALLIEAGSLSSLWTMRDTLLDIFKALDDPLQLRFVLDNGNTRQLDCWYIDDFGLSSKDKIGFSQRIGITLDAADPAFYDPASKTVNFGLTGGVDAFPIPMPIPLGIGASILDQTVVVNYVGSFLTYPWRIRIVGPITNPIITNLDTDEKLEFTGTIIAAGEYYDIDCRYSYKTVTEDDGTNRIDKLTNDSDLATWHLGADPEVTGGLNDIRVQGSAVTAATEVHIQYYERFVGI